MGLVSWMCWMMCFCSFVDWRGRIWSCRNSQPDCLLYLPVKEDGDGSMCRTNYFDKARTDKGRAIDCNECAFEAVVSLMNDIAEADIRGIDYGIGSTRLDSVVHVAGLGYPE